jgi:hypothetical protein
MANTLQRREQLPRSPLSIPLSRPPFCPSSAGELLSSAGANIDLVAPVASRSDHVMSRIQACMQATTPTAALPASSGGSCVQFAALVRTLTTTVHVWAPLVYLKLTLSHSCV